MDFGAYAAAERAACSEVRPGKPLSSEGLVLCDRGLFLP